MAADKHYVDEVAAEVALGWRRSDCRAVDRGVE